MPARSGKPESASDDHLPSFAALTTEPATRAFARTSAPRGLPPWPTDDPASRRRTTPRVSPAARSPSPPALSDAFCNGPLHAGPRRSVSWGDGSSAAAGIGLWRASEHPLPPFKATRRREDLRAADGRAAIDVQWGDCVRPNKGCDASAGHDRVTPGRTCPARADIASADWSSQRDRRPECLTAAAREVPRLAHLPPGPRQPAPLLS